MYEYWYYTLAKDGNNVNLCNLDTVSFIVYIKTKVVYADLVKDVEKRFDTPNYEVDRPLSVGENKN